MLKAVDLIINIAIKPGQLSTTGLDTPPAIALPQLALPHKVQTAIQGLGLEPKLVQTICCPQCFKQYPLGHLPQICKYRSTGVVENVERSCGQLDLESWLKYFSSCLGIEDKFNKSYQHRSNPAEMGSVWDSLAWHSLGSFTMMPGNLTFSYFIDWFNPFTNKIAGKTVLAGAIMFFCLNLPSHLQHHPEYMYFAGIMPPPKEPTMETITAVSDLIIDQFKCMWTGKNIKTCQHPHGTFKRVGVLAAVGNLLAIRKGFGFADVGSNAHFSSFCTLHKDNIEELDPQRFEHRLGTAVRAAVEERRTATMVKRQGELFKENGVCWSSLNRLLYHNPVQHALLGLMHNWIEGVLQHHARCRWGLGADVGNLRRDAAVVLAGDDEEGPGKSQSKNSHTDIEMLDDEIQGLFEETVQARSQPTTEAAPLSAGGSLFNIDIGGDDDSDDSNFVGNDSMGDCSDSTDNSDHSDSTGDNMDDELDVGPNTFTPGQLSQIRLCIAKATIPSWVEQPPTNLGEKSHGKLKADQWLKLFSVFLPFILPEIWTSAPTPTSQNLLGNFYSLVTCTNLVCLYTVSKDSADLYLYHYINYRKSSRDLFPHAPSFLGTANSTSEFPYEQHNGTLQKIKTNGHMWEIDLTMLCQICRQGCIMSILDDDILSSEHGHKIASALLNGKSPMQVKGQQKLTEHEYSKWLAYIIRDTPITSTFRHHAILPHPDRAAVLPHWTAIVMHIHHNTRNYSTLKAHSV
ncbi:hypothetical protein FA15DRAFT_707718 [Coprinopsis marcescibilis]|uniref:Uncharacterized protein n=1 Tax=Coprinopsis marcescibilis TaxID=230819 RepID=A0A5C3KY58_COPMA|nr:hypothetical protein FA15DRAFT_707718 [Coprinopsis marcescibilis]